MVGEDDLGGKMVTLWKFLCGAQVRIVLCIGALLYFSYARGAACIYSVEKRVGNDAFVISDVCKDVGVIETVHFRSGVAQTVIVSLANIAQAVLLATQKQGVDAHSGHKEESIQAVGTVVVNGIAAVAQAIAEQDTGTVCAQCGKVHKKFSLLLLSQKDPQGKWPMY